MDVCARVCVGKTPRERFSRDPVLPDVSLLISSYYKKTTPPHSGESSQRNPSGSANLVSLRLAEIALKLG